MGRFRKILAVVLAFCLCFASAATMNVSAAAKKTVVVKTQKQLEKALKNKEVGTIKIKTSKNVDITIPNSKNAKTKHLIVNSKNASITNKATFKKITFNGDASRSFVENGKQNKILINKPVNLTVGKKATVASIESKSTQATVTVKLGGTVTTIIANKADGKLGLIAYGTIGNVVAKLASNLIISGGKGAEVSITVEETAKGTTLKADIAIKADLKADTTVTLTTGAEKSDIKTTGDATVTVDNKTSEDVSITTPAGKEEVKSGSTAEADKEGVTEKDDTTPTPTTPPSTDGGGSSGGSGGGSGTTTVPVESVELDQSTASLSLDGTKTVALKVTVKPDNATTKTVTWTSSKETVATVKDGVVTAVGAGETVITATSNNGKTATCKVTVTDSETPPVEKVPVTSVELQETLGLVVNDTKQLTAIVLPENATNKAVTWESKNTNVVTVDSTGSVKAVGAGETTITVTSQDDSSKTATCAVKVTKTAVQVESVSITTPGALTVNSTATIECTINPADATNPTIEWESGDTSVATIVQQTADPKKATITAVKAGESTIKVTVTSQDGSSKTATCIVTAENAGTSEVPVTSVELQGTLDLVVSATGQLTATVLPENATNKAVTWESKNTNVVTVDNTGLVTAVSKGTATITVTSQDDSSKTATCTVTVTENDPVTPPANPQEITSLTVGIASTTGGAISGAAISGDIFTTTGSAIATITLNCAEAVSNKNIGITSRAVTGTSIKATIENITATTSDSRQLTISYTFDVEQIDVKVSDIKKALQEATYKIDGVTYTYSASN